MGVGKSDYNLQEPDTASSSVIYSLGARMQEKEKEEEGGRREDPRVNTTRLHLLPWQL